MKGQVHKLEFQQLPYIRMFTSCCLLMKQCYSCCDWSLENCYSSGIFCFVFSGVSIVPMQLFFRVWWTKLSLDWLLMFSCEIKVHFYSPRGRYSVTDSGFHIICNESYSYLWKHYCSIVARSHVVTCSSVYKKNLVTDEIPCSTNATASWGIKFK
jgi:hypothetical protein